MLHQETYSYLNTDVDIEYFLCAKQIQARKLVLFVMNLETKNWLFNFLLFFLLLQFYKILQKDHLKFWGQIKKYPEVCSDSFNLDRTLS